MMARAQLRLALNIANKGGYDAYMTLHNSRLCGGSLVIEDEAGDGSEITSLREMFNTDDRSDIMDAYNDSLLQYAM